MKKLIAAVLVILMTAPALAQGNEEMRQEMKQRIEMFEQMLAKLRMEYERMFGKDEKKAESEDVPDVELKAGEMLFLLNDGNRMKGRLSIDSLKLKTSYGTLTIPANQIKWLNFAGKSENASDKDTVETVEFTASGTLEIEKMEVETKHGKLTFKKGDIKNIIFPPPAGEKNFEVKPTGEWLNTGITLKKGETLTITATGELSGSSAKFKPDGSAQTKEVELEEGWGRARRLRLGESENKPSFPLVARIGENGKPFKTGAAFKGKAEEEGILFLKVDIPESSAEVAKALKGCYKAKVFAPGKAAARPTAKQEEEAAAALARAKAFDKANPYEDREIVSAKYHEVAQKYPGTKAAKEASEKAKEVMQRRK